MYRGVIIGFRVKSVLNSAVETMATTTTTMPTNRRIDMQTDSRAVSHSGRQAGSAAQTIISRTKQTKCSVDKNYQFYCLTTTIKHKCLHHQERSPRSLGRRTATMFARSANQTQLARRFVLKILLISSRRHWTK